MIPINRFLLAMVGLLAFGHSSFLAAAEGTTAANQPGATFKLATTERKTPSGSKVTYGILLAATNKFSFILPSEFRVQADATAKKIFLSTRDSAVLMEVGITEALTGTLPELKLESLRQLVRQRHPDSLKLEESVAYAGGLTGQGFTFQTVNANHEVVATRLAFVPFPGGQFEFRMTTAEKKLSLFHDGFNSLLLSFRSSPINGKLELQVLNSD